MKYLDKIIQELVAKDFHDGKPQREHFEYYTAAEDQINCMTNMQLLNLIGEVNSDD